MTQDQFIRALLTAAQEAGITAAEAYYQSEETLTVRAFEGAVDDYAVSTSGGLSLRGLVGGRMARPIRKPWTSRLWTCWCAACWKARR